MANANERVVNGINTRVLHNKDYVEVAERVRIVHELKKKFEMVESAPYSVADRWLWKVTIRVDDILYIGSAEAKLNAPKNTPDGTNPFECAETSALGRALAFAGLGTVQSIASYDEIARSRPFIATIEQPNSGVVDAPNAPKQIAQPATTDDPKVRLNALYKRAVTLGLIEHGADGAAFLKHISDIIGANVVSPAQLTKSRLDTVEQFLNAKDVA